MISKQDILERAREWQLRPEVVEKDYVLGWLLAAVALHEETSANWILKGGTCVKKCFFETYRFSEDLDFSLLPEAAYSEDAIRVVLGELTGIASELSGIEFSADALAVRVRDDKLGRTTYEGKIGYRGPLAIPTWPRVLFDITAHEPVVDEPVRRPILHPYPDGPLPDDALVSTYSSEELIAEKTRALFERSRPRDVYDVIYILTNTNADIQFAHAREVFIEKCVSKNLTVPTARDLIAVVNGDVELRSEWSNMLAHQLSALPEVEHFVSQLAAVLSWMDADPPLNIPAQALASLAAGATETILAPNQPHVWHTSVPLELIRFAGATRMLIEFNYKGQRRLVEPYSLRRSSRNNLLLYAWELSSSKIKCFDIGKMSALKATQQSFTARFNIDFTGSGPMDPITVPRMSSRVTSHSTSRRATKSDLTYVFRCPTCLKEFRHSRNDSTLRRHTMPGSTMYCSSRRGYLDRVV